MALPRAKKRTEIKRKLNIKPKKKKEKKKIGEREKTKDIRNQYPSLDSLPLSSLRQISSSYFLPLFQSSPLSFVILREIKSASQRIKLRAGGKKSGKNREKMKKNARMVSRVGAL